MNPAGVSASRDVVTIGASAGGVTALLQLVAALPRNLPAAVLIVQHIGNNPSVLPLLLTSHGNNRAVHAEQDQPVELGTIYVAPPDHHMLVKDGKICLSHGPKEHHTRPAVDPLFRSAAVEYGPRGIGVVLTGRLDDGTAGMQAIKQCGGLAVVQDPADAEHPSMPQSAMRSVAVDCCVPLSAMGETIVRLLKEPLPATTVTEASEAAALEEARHRNERELAVIAGEGHAVEILNSLGKPSTFACPDCDGVLWEIGDVQPPRYRCHTGHAFSMRSLEATQATSTEDAIWAATRALQTREELMRRLAEANSAAGAAADAERDRAAAEEAARHAQLLLKMLNAR